MSSSLDELQPNDYLQLELDEYLEKFIQSLEEQNNSERTYFYINQFIEYICFHQNLGSLEQLKSEGIFTEYYYLIESLTGEADSNEINRALKEYFLFIHASGKSIPEFLLQL